MMRGCFLASLLCCSMLASAASAAAASSAPDLSGAWARTIFALEPPASGAGPLRNAPRQGDAGPAYTSPILKPAAAAIVKQRYESTQAGKPYPTPSETCWPMVAPMIYRVREMQVVQNKDEVLLIYMQDHEVRRIRIGGTHPANLTPTWHGDSIGHYEGDTLVVDTIAQNAKTVVDGFHTPHTEQLHVVERFHLIDGGETLEVNVHVEDPGAFTLPWNAIQRYRRFEETVSKGNAASLAVLATPEEGPLMEAICAENPNSLGMGARTIPETAVPDF